MTTPSSPASAAASSSPLRFGTDGVVDLDVTWHAGWPSAKHDPAPEIQSHHLNEHTVLMRQNMSVNYEAPFMFLFFGAASAVLIDTGATAEPEYFPLRRVVDEHVERWLAKHPREDYRLTVVHTHGHGDHRSGDGQFADRERTTVVGPQLPEVAAFYGFGDWPATPRELDLGGGRIVDVIPSPGHHSSAVTFYDRYTRLLLTGDSLYPGRLYVDDWAAFQASFDRLAAWSETHEISHVLGCHIEMSTDPGEDYPIGWNHQPDEAALPMTAAHIIEVQRRLREIDGKPGRHSFDEFHIWYQA
ncbi:MBL fold metallo-hydrolase [Phytomonospora endophytica]|uniref:Glyoxylase-like metal-dependent hydrolase (Beta-lactamase superfamily II) n=1 Tax=Phytomonospora endophytica TaxID=714109 RepID=A0A841FWL6_9ACTN|nr:MBL fold metallo-hydrolase [Phytomonospora endophytica]MBB6036879.1 glyoxylase-like metal-dependent hydrolase (beta-lactamase superfamily II) [Phytomonospora endophytica]GIG68087.1 hypothetical protein Pen01_43820 [Phytomonospora endophytica]